MSDMDACARCGHERAEHYYDGAFMLAGGGPECAVHNRPRWWRRARPCGCRRFQETAAAAHGGVA